MFVFLVCAEADVRSEECVSVQEAEPSQRPHRCPVRAVLRVAAGAVLGVGMATVWVWAAKSAKNTLTHFNASFFIFWFCSIWNLLMFPLYYTGYLLTGKHRETPAARLRSLSHHSPKKHDLKVCVTKGRSY